MKCYLPVLLVISIWAVSCVQKPALDSKTMKILADTAGYTTLAWQDSVVQFGKAPMGEMVQIKFHFRNTGTHPLYLANVRAGCGCTVPDYTKGAIPPGGEGDVTGAFDTKLAHVGEVRKAIFVTANTRYKTSHTLIFTGQITEPVSE
jgi:hypothetical protein